MTRKPLPKVRKRKYKKPPSFYTKSLVALFYDLENTNTQSKKIKILQNYPHKKLIKKILQLVYNPLLFNTDSDYLQSKYEFCGFQEKYRNADKRLRSFLKLLGRLPLIANKNVSLTNILKYLTKSEFFLYQKFFNRKLNIDYKVIEMVFPYLIIQPKGFMSGNIYHPSMKIEFPVLCEPYLKGCKIKLVASPKGVTQAYSVNLRDYTLIFEPQLKVLQSISKKINKTIEVDILVPKNGWGESKFYVLDFIIQKKTTKSLTVRKSEAKKYITLLRQEKTIKAMPVPVLIATNYIELNRISEKFTIHKKFKGIIIKDSLSCYVPGLSNFWLKYYNIVIKKARVLAVVKHSSYRSIIIKLPSGAKKMISNLSSNHQNFIKNNRKRLKKCICKLECKSNCSRLLEVNLADK